MVRASCALRLRRRSESTALPLRSRYGLFIRDCSRRRFAHFKLGAYFLDLRCLLVQTRYHSSHFLLLLRDRCFKFVTLFLGVLSLLRNRSFQYLHLLVLFEELVEQHRIHLVVEHAVGFSFFVAHHQLSIRLSHLLGDKAELRYAWRINLLFVMEGDWFERVERFTGLIHRPDVFLKAL